MASLIDNLNYELALLEERREKLSAKQFVNMANKIDRMSYEGFGAPEALSNIVGKRKSYAVLRACKNKALTKAVLLYLFSNQSGLTRSRNALNLFFHLTSIADQRKRITRFLKEYVYAIASQNGLAIGCSVSQVKYEAYAVRIIADIVGNRELPRLRLLRPHYIYLGALLSLNKWSAAAGIVLVIARYTQFDSVVRLAKKVCQIAMVEQSDSAEIMHFLNQEIVSRQYPVGFKRNAKTVSSPILTGSSDSTVFVARHKFKTHNCAFTLIEKRLCLGHSSARAELAVQKRFLEQNIKTPKRWRFPKIFGVRLDTVDEASIYMEDVGEMFCDQLSLGLQIDACEAIGEMNGLFVVDGIQTELKSESCFDAAVEFQSLFGKRKFYDDLNVGYEETMGLLDDLLSMMESKVSTAPKSISHGDLGSSNFGLIEGKVVIVDWGGARVRSAGSDLAVLLLRNEFIHPLSDSFRLESLCPYVEAYRTGFCDGAAPCTIGRKLLFDITCLEILSFIFEEFNKVFKRSMGNCLSKEAFKNKLCQAISLAGVINLSVSKATQSDRDR